MGMDGGWDNLSLRNTPPNRSLPLEFKFPNSNSPFPHLRREGAAHSEISLKETLLGHDFFFFARFKKAFDLGRLCKD